MNFSTPLAEGTLIKRYRRFLADITTQTGELLTIHCPNTGSMKHCNQPGSRVWYSDSQSPTRKYPHTWEIVENEAGDRIGINTHRANGLVEEAIVNGLITELQGFTDLQREVKYGEQNSRIDLLLHMPAGRCYVEVKNLTLLEGEQGQGYFPDAETVRGTKHLQELVAMVEAGHRAVLCFCVQHTGVKTVSAAGHIDSLYAETLHKAQQKGVEVIAYQAQISPQAIQLVNSVPVILQNTSVVLD